MAKSNNETNNFEAVSVICRIRPFTEKELSEAEESCTNCLENPGVVKIDDGTQQHQYKFDGVFDQVSGFAAVSNGQVVLTQGYQANQKSIFLGVGQKMISSMLSGVNCTIFLYGQTGTGKSYTVYGDRNRMELDPGLAPRVIQKMFSILTKAENEPNEVSEIYSKLISLGIDSPTKMQEASPALLQTLTNLYGNRYINWIPSFFSDLPPCAKLLSWEIKVSYLEIYMEKIYDLLGPTKHTGGLPELSIRVFPNVGAVLPDLTEVKVTNLREALKQLRLGNDKRQIRSTHMNAHSSRSHAIFSISVKLTMIIPKGSDELSEKTITRISKLNLVDLAGRENERTTLAKDTSFRELAFINKSLFYLSRCIQDVISTPLNSITRQSAFRNCKLTLILGPYITGNSRTIMIATLSPAKSAVEENIITCKFARSIKRIHTLPISDIMVQHKLKLNSVYTELFNLAVSVSPDMSDNFTYTEGLTEEEQKLFLTETFNKLYSKYVKSMSQKVQTLTEKNEKILSKIKQTKTELDYSTTVINQIFQQASKIYRNASLNDTQSESTV